MSDPTAIRPFQDADDNSRNEWSIQWDLVFDAIPDHIALIDERLRLVRVNHSLAEAIGKTTGELAGEPCYRYLCGNDLPPKDCPHQKTLQDGKVHTLELHLEHLGGDYIITTSLLRGRNGGTAGIVHVGRDITHRRRAEDALRQSESRFRSLVEQSLVGIYIISNGRFLYVNPRLAEIFGYRSPDEIVFGAGTMDLIAPESRNMVAESDRRRLSGEVQSIHYLFKGLRKDGAVIDIEAYGSRTEIDGKPAIIGTLLDITEKLRFEEMKRRMEERQFERQKQQSIATLAGGIAHDFNNMLMGVIGSAELLRADLSPGGAQRRNVDVIIDLSRRMAGLTRQLLDYSRQGVTEHRETSLNEIVRGRVDEVRRGREKTAEFHLDLAPDLWTIMADAGQVGQMITSVLVNAIESVEEGAVVISVLTENIRAKAAWDCQLNHHPTGDYVHLRISDTGPGIAPELRSRIFEPFFTTKFMGRGLGLATAKGIIQNHGGCMTVESEKGRGTTIDIHFPRTATAAGTGRPKGEKEEPETVLVVDDEPHVLGLLRIMLTELGYGTLLAGSNDEALRIFEREKERIRLAILDIQMQGKRDVHGLFRTLKERNPEIKVLISSGYDERTAMEGFGGDRPDGFIQKPYWVDTLKAKVLDLMGSGPSPAAPPLRPGGARSKRGDDRDQGHQR